MNPAGRATRRGRRSGQVCPEEQVSSAPSRSALLSRTMLELCECPSAGSLWRPSPGGLQVPSVSKQSSRRCSLLDSGQQGGWNPLAWRNTGGFLWRRVSSVVLLLVSSRERLRSCVTAETGGRGVHSGQVRPRPVRPRLRDGNWCKKRIPAEAGGIKLAQGGDSKMAIQEYWDLFAGR